MDDFDASTSDAPDLTPSASTRAVGDNMWQQTLGPSSDMGGSDDHFLTDASLADPLMGVESPPPFMANKGTTTIGHTAMTQVSPSVPTFPPSVMSSSGPRKQHMKQLTRLGMLMDELQNAYSDKQADQTIPFNAFPSEYFGNVLQAATLFLNTLESFFHEDFSASSSELSESRTPSLNSSDSFPDHQDNGQNPPSFLNLRRNFPDTLFDTPPSSYESLIFTSNAPSQNFSVSSTTSSTRRIASAINKPAVLQLIACHLSFLQLYVLLYTAVHEYAQTNGPDVRRAAPIWPSLRLGSASLAAYADVQIALVLQIAAQLLVDIEDSLGLPDSCLVSGRNRSNRRSSAGFDTGSGSGGVLGASGISPSFIELSISEAGVAGQGGNVIARLRKVMGQVARLLEPDSTVQVKRTRPARNHHYHPHHYHASSDPSMN